METALAFDEALLPEDSWIDDTGEDYEVEEIMDVRDASRTRNGRRKKEYLVKWVGDYEDTWEPEDNLTCTALLYEFDARRAWENRREAAQTADESEESSSEGEEGENEVEEQRGKS